MEDNNNDNIVEIDKVQYEKLVRIGMEWGIDDPTEFINAVLGYQIKKEQGGRGTGCKYCERRSNQGRCNTTPTNAKGWCSSISKPWHNQIHILL